MKVYYDEDADLSVLKDKTVAIVGFGIQGQAQALNLRDSGIQVIVGNRSDAYSKAAKEHGFELLSISEAVKRASVVLVLIPDQAHKSVFENEIRPHLNPGDTLLFAHGYSVHFKQLIPPKDVNVCLLAPRMPGKPIREFFQRGGGVPAFVDVHQDSTGNAKLIALALGKAMGFTKAGLMEISFKEETELDLFIEQFFLPLLIRSIRLSFDVLVKKGYTPEAILMELYASGEVGKLLTMAADIGIYGVWKNHASPTCQFGIFRNSPRVLPDEIAKELITTVINEIQDGTFQSDLDQEARAGYENLYAYDQCNEESQLTHVQKNLARIIKFRESQ